MSSKMITVWGSPVSGKTTLATKLAAAICSKYKADVIVVYTNSKTPDIPMHISDSNGNRKASLGNVLAQTTITQNAILQELIPVPKRADLGILSYRKGENLYTYPAFDCGKARELFLSLKALADIVVIDAQSDFGDALSMQAIEDADIVLRLATPDLKSMSFYASQSSLYMDPKFGWDRHIQGLGILERDVYLPVEDVKVHFKNVRFVVPYCVHVKQGMLGGDLFGCKGSRAYEDMIDKLAEKMVD